jgi:hypothetical protein
MPTEMRGPANAEPATSAIANIAFFICLLLSQGERASATPNGMCMILLAFGAQGASSLVVGGHVSGGLRPESRRPIADLRSHHRH